MIPPRYLPSIRRNEIAAACLHAQRGESLCFVGMAGVGKSNVVRILRYNDEIKTQYLGPETKNIHFVVVDGTTWEGTAASLNYLMLTAIDPVMEAKRLTLPESKRRYLDETVQLRRQLEESVNLICKQPATKLVFILDDFDAVMAKGPLPMLENLSAMRNAENREKLSYVVITKRLPHKLAACFDELRGSKFYDLFKLNIYALGPYVREDALQMMLHANALAGNPLGRHELPKLLYLAGNHARLMKIVFETWLKQPPPNGNDVVYFSGQPDVRSECQRILNALHPQEADVARRFVRDQLTPADAPTVQHLVTRGFITDVARRELFSPLMAEYLNVENGGVS
ncbi:MAG: AAA family ATPase [Caldilineaceae bacterium]|nr:AAA family ATPase [Caldilineaceae bacterium]